MTTRGQGRPPATTHGAIEEAAFALFEARGFEATTMDDIAASLGVGRRTLFRYYASKNDILWGQFDQSLVAFRASLAAGDPGLPVWAAVREAVIDFNRFEAAALPQHRRRMRLLLGTPALQAHSELRYAAWRSVVADFVAQRLGVGADDLAPVLLGRVAVAVAVSAYERWLADPDASLEALIGQAADEVGSIGPA